MRGRQQPGAVTAQARSLFSVHTADESLTHVRECLRFLRSNVSPHERVQGNRYGPDPVPLSYSEHIGNTFGPKGFSIGSARHGSSSKYFKSWCMKVTSQIWSPTWVTPTFCVAWELFHRGRRSSGNGSGSLTAGFGVGCPWAWSPAQVRTGGGTGYFGGASLS